MTLHDLIILLGVILLTGIILQTLIGLRIIRFKGPTHMRVHRSLAYVLIAGGVVHGGLAVGTFVFGWF